MTGLLGYVAIDSLRSQRWVVPLLSFAVIDAVISAHTGPVLPSYAIAATVLLFTATALTVVIVNTEDPIQQTVTEVCAGSKEKVRLSKLTVSFVFSVMIGLVGMIAPTIFAGSGKTLSAVASGICAQVITALIGVTFGSICSRPIVSRRSWSVLLGTVLGMATVVIPNGPPTRQILVLFNKTQPFSLGGPVLLIAAETLVLAGIVTAASLRIARLRV